MRIFSCVKYQKEKYPNKRKGKGGAFKGHYLFRPWLIFIKKKKIHIEPYLHK